jgi:hypothetical protein
VAAIVLDHEQAHQESRGGNREQQPQPPVTEMDGRPDERPQRDQRQEGDGDFQQAPCSAGIAIMREDLRPDARTASGRDMVLSMTGQSDDLSLFSREAP